MRRAPYSQPVSPIAAGTTVAELSSLLTRTIDLVSEVTDSDAIWMAPWQQSQAEAERAAEESRRPEPQGGAWPWLVAPMVARWGLCVAVDEARGFRAVLQAETTSYSADVLCRAVLESCSLAWWLLDPEVDAGRRLARSLLYRAHSAKWTCRAVNALGLGADEDPTEYGELPGEVKQEVSSLGLALKTGGRQLVCGEEVWPDYADRVATLVQAVWPQPRVAYAVLSAVAHAGLLGIGRNLSSLRDEVKGGSAGGVTSLRPVPDPTGFWFWHDTCLVSGALVLSVERAALFLGLREQVAALQVGKAELDRVLAALRPDL